MVRYLMYISYIGTGFRGLQRQGNRPLKTVISVIEDALNSVRPGKFSDVVTSSRTDRGVHALCNTVHVDLISGNYNDTDLKSLTSSLNKCFQDFEEDIRILKVMRVADNFHSRFQAINRTYVYRVCVMKSEDDWFSPFLPFESSRCCCFRRPLDIEKMRRGSEMLTGIRDFSAFTNLSVLEDQEWQNPIKNMTARVEKGEGFMSEGCWLSSAADRSEYWNIVFKSHSFLYRQVRRMTAALLGVGSGLLSLEELGHMLSHPTQTSESTHRVYSQIKVPSYGLYLTDVEYLEKDLRFVPGENVITESSVDEINHETTDEKLSAIEQCNESDTECLDNENVKQRLDIKMTNNNNN